MRVVAGTPGERSGGAAAPGPGIRAIPIALADAGHDPRQRVADVCGHRAEAGRASRRRPPRFGQDPAPGGVAVVFRHLQLQDRQAGAGQVVVATSDGIDAEAVFGAPAGQQAHDGAGPVQEGLAGRLSPDAVNEDHADSVGVEWCRGRRRVRRLLRAGGAGPPAAGRTEQPIPQAPEAGWRSHVAKVSFRSAAVYHLADIVLSRATAWPPRAGRPRPPPRRNGAANEPAGRPCRSWFGGGR